MGLTRALSTGSLTTALKQFGKGLPGLDRLPGAKHATDDSYVMQEESGDWKYMVIDPKGIRARDDASYSKNTKSTELARYPEGAVVEVDRRRRVGWTTWLGLKSGDGWLFDASPKDKKVRMVQVEVLSGQWMYEACMFQRVPVLPRPSLSTSSSGKLPLKSTNLLEIREVVSVTERVRPVSGKGTFLRLADGRGWVLDFADGHRVLQRWKYPQEGAPAEDSSNGSSGSSEVSSNQRNTTSSPIGQGTAFEASDDCTTGMEPAELGPAEQGSWDYVVLDPRGLSLRSKPTYDPNEKIARRVEEGEIVEVKERRAGDGTTFLRLACPGGWVFDRQPGKGSRVRMMEVEIERGAWHYMVVASSGVALRTRCSFSDESKCGQGPLKGAIIQVVARVKVGETTFLQLKDGGKWVFDSKGGRKVVVHVDIQEPAAGTRATVKCHSGVQLLAAPTNQKWAAGKMRLLHQAQVEVTALFEAEFTKWAHVTKPGSGMQGWLLLEDLSLEESEKSIAAAASGLRNVGSALAHTASTSSRWQQAWNPSPGQRNPLLA